MARHLLRNLALSGAAALSFATVTSPSTNEKLSTQRGNAEAAVTSYERFSTEASAIAREYDALAFQERSLQEAQKSLATAQGDVAGQVRALEELNTQFQQRITARNDRRQKFHDDILMDPHLSEADLNAIYTGPMEGTYYAYYYTELMAYRDECKRDTTCMETMQNSEFNRKAADYSLRAAGAFTGTLGGLFGLSALGGAAGRWRRRREESKHRDRLASTRDMLTPKK